MRLGESIFIVVQACTLLCQLLILWENILAEQEGCMQTTTNNTTNSFHILHVVTKATNPLTGKAITHTKLNKDGVLVHLLHNIVLDENMWE